MIKNWDKMKVYDLTQNTSHLSPPWPTYEPLQVKFFKRLSPNGANGMLITTSNHVGTHLDGPLHFDTPGRDIASLEMAKLMGPGVVVDLSDIAEDWSIYTPQDIMDRVEVKTGDIIYINTGYHRYGFDQPEA
ncbi:MAG: cyclase family protein, partial [Anaerolineaceae bacterium]|nr:cyclase family protein [Anaerolineaceae bacterium]